ncbi:MAG: molybdopterin-dependent oxidoreductase [Chloroflexota bacterium]|nr:molybdopterin-dependent oxidoreductase [Chloroflexota bacterium]
MKSMHWLKAAGLGLIAGLAATAVLVLTFAVMRTWLGISPPPEAIPDRLAPTLDISTFFSLFGRFGGYNGLKKLGIQGGLAGLIAVGALVGIIYSVLTASPRARAAGSWRGWSRLGLGFVVATALILWVAMLIVLWPVLGANYRGVPPSQAQFVTAAGYLVAFALYGLVLVLVHRWLVPPLLATAPGLPFATGAPVGRRAVVAGAATAALAVPSFALIRRLYDRATFSYDGTPYSGPGVEPIAPNDAFYTVTKNVADPNVNRGVWGLQVDGLVERPHQYGFEELAALAATEQETTLMCISNQIGAGLFSNAIWTGVPLRDLLEAARPADTAVEVLLYAADGYTDTFSIEKAMDPTTLVAVAMNGEPLPQRHGYPARVVVPGLFGEKNVKWVTRITVVDYDAKGFYEQQGWGPNFEVPTRSDIFGPRWRRAGGDAFVDSFAANEVATIRGRAFAGARGVQSVEFSADDGETWQPAAIDYPGTDLTWSFWSVAWRPAEAGEFILLSRATDGTGAVQSGEQRSIVPQGATGYHRVRATVV